MARKPNYKFERRERDRLKAVKNAERVAAKKEARERAKAEAGTAAPAVLSKQPVKAVDAELALLTPSLSLQPASRLRRRQAWYMGKMVGSRSCHWGAVAATARWCGAATSIAFALLCAVRPALAEPPGAPAAAPRPSVDAICRTLVQAAAANDLPQEFFIRLIWQESRFDPSAISPMGAQGIAQFMPATAAMRGLTNAFEPLQALRESASYLRELRITFSGNLGLAAAAYNAGPAAVAAWRAGRAALPFETQAYVRLVTGYTAETWTARQMPQMASAPPLADALIGARCVELANLVVNHAVPRRDYTADPAWGPWGVQLAGSFSEGDVLARFERVRRRYEAVLGDHLPLVVPGRLTDASTYVVRISAKSRADADALCTRLRAAGGACIVLSNPRS